MYCPQILYEFDYGGSTSLDIRVMDNSTRRTNSAFLGSSILIKTLKSGTNVPLNTLLDLSPGFDHNSDEFDKYLLLNFHFVK